MSIPSTPLPSAASPLEPGYSRPKEFFPPTGIVY
jgi:hypothetical protein